MRPSARAALAGTVLAAGFLCSVPAWAESVALGYSIRKEGEPIGQERVTINRDGDAALVEVRTTTRAKVLFLEFRYDHNRREEWRGGRLVRMVADTDDDGTKSKLEAVRKDGGWTFTVNGQSAERPGDALPLTLWGRAILDRKELFSIIDAKPYGVQVAALGNETVNVDGTAQQAEHFRITGDVERDLWYGADGYLLRAAFQRSGYPIEVVRTERRP